MLRFIRFVSMRFIMAINTLLMVTFAVATGPLLPFGLISEADVATIPRWSDHKITGW